MYILFSWNILHRFLWLLLLLSRLYTLRSIRNIDCFIKYIIFYNLNLFTLFIIFLII